MPLDGKVDWAEAILDIVGGIADNWFFLCRIGVLKWRSEFEEKWVDRASTIPTIIIYTM